MNGGGFNELLNQLEVFEKALRQVMDLPGNWHAGLSMLSSIVTLFYDSLLKPIADMVWCGSISTRKLTSVTIKRHVSYIIHEQLLKITWQRYISERYGTMKAEFNNKMLNSNLAFGNANFLCYCAQGFQDYVKADLQSMDHLCIPRL